MEDSLVQMVRLRDMINENQRRIKEERETLRTLTSAVLEFMNAQEIKTVTNVDGAYTVSLVKSDRLPPMNLEWVQACLMRYLQSASSFANAADAANYVFEERKNNKQTVMRIQVRKQGPTRTSSGSSQLVQNPPPDDNDDDEDQNDQEENNQVTYTPQTLFQF